MATGVLEGADVTVGNSYETASAISKGDLNTQSAFMAGKLKVTGNLAKLMMHQGAVNQWAAAVKEIPVDY
jgi:putative sterol carrier protein